jgi:hypothetical protein
MAQRRAQPTGSVWIWLRLRGGQPNAAWLLTPCSRTVFFSLTRPRNYEQSRQEILTLVFSYNSLCGNQACSHTALRTHFLSSNETSNLRQRRLCSIDVRFGRQMLRCWTVPGQFKFGGSRSATCPCAESSLRATVGQEIQPDIKGFGTCVRQRSGTFGYVAYGNDAASLLGAYIDPDEMAQRGRLVIVRATLTSRCSVMEKPEPVKTSLTRQPANLGFHLPGSSRAREDPLVEECLGYFWGCLNPSTPGCRAVQVSGLSLIGEAAQVANNAKIAAVMAKQCAIT